MSNPQPYNLDYTRNSKHAFVKDEILNNEEPKIEVVVNKRVLESKEKNKINSIILSDSIKHSNKVDIVDKNKSKEIKVAQSQQKDIKKSINNF